MKFAIPRAAILAVCLAGTTAPARTWTSASGKTLEADLVEIQGDNAILQRANGSRVSIRLTKLSARDQAYLAELDQPAPEAPPESTPAPAAEPEQPEPEPAAARQKDTATFPGVTFAKPPPLATADFPSIGAVPDGATVLYWGFQYGPSEKEVVYFAFVQDDWESLYSKGFMYSPGLPTHQKPVPMKFKKKKVREEPVHVFAQIPLQARHGKQVFNLELEFVNGIARPDILLFHVTANMTTAGKLQRFVYGDFINEQLVSDSEAIPVVQSLGAVRMRFSVQLRSKSWELQTSFNMDGLRWAPAKGMDDSVRVQSFRPDGKVAEKFDIELNPDAVRSIDGPRFSSSLKKVKPGVTYEVTGSIDLGPLLGTLEVSHSLTGVEEEDED